MNVFPYRVLGYRERVLRPNADARAGSFAYELLTATTDAIEDCGLGLVPQRQPDRRKVVFAVDVGVTLGYLEIGLIRGPVDAHSLVVALTIPGDLAERRAEACAHELLCRQLAPDADAWTLGSWMPIPRRSGHTGFGLTHGLFVPLALAESGMGTEIATAAARTVDLVRAWFDDGAPVPVPVPLQLASSRERLVA